MKKLLIFIITAVLLYHFTSSPVYAVSTPPFAAFSIEGNPPEDYYFGPIFNLFRYIKPSALQIFESMDRSRVYEELDVCNTAEADRRDYICNNQGDGCDGGEIDMCYVPDYTFAETHNSGHTACTLPKDTPKGTSQIIEGTCDYTKVPKMSHEIKGTDFSIVNNLVFPKIQSESNIYSYMGSDNSITWGSLYLSSDACEIAVHKLMVVYRAKQTQDTLAQTGEWPLGWVDWGYKDENMTKTLLDIYNELPGDIAGKMKNIIEGTDDFFLNGGNLDAVSDISSAKNYVCNVVTKVGSQSSKPTWLIDLETVPMYSPSYRQGYERSSICVRDICCPSDRCKIDISGNPRTLNYDLSISQTFGAALDNLFTIHSLNEGIKLYVQIVAKNPIVMFLTSAGPEATPTRIKEKLAKVGASPCLEYIPWNNWLGFGTHIDYLNSNNFLGPNQTCPDYQLMPEVNKETAGARSSNPQATTLSLIWGIIDDVLPVKYHLIIIPDLMAQSIADIQQPVQNTRDTATELESISDFNLNLSNTIDDNADYLPYGKRTGPQIGLRNIGLYSCSDDMFSAQTQTSIETYALGIRSGCFDDSAVPEGKCDGQLFGKLLESGKYQQSSPKGETYFNTYIKGNLTPELMNTYAAAEKETGVPCEILAGIHFVEADNNPNGSLVSGREIGTPEPDAGGRVFHSLLETAKYAGDHLKGKVGGNLKDVNTVITALSRYNGGGNSNCQAGYPYPIPYGGCPRAFEGEDDPYPMSFVDPKHDKMYLLYCADHTACVPEIFERPGAFAVALNVYNSFTKSGYENSQLPPTQTNPAPSPSISPDGSTASTGFFPRSCGPESLSTALGCIPYTRDAFVSALLTFIIGLSGGIALVIMLIATFQIMTAGGNPEQLKKGKELFVSAIVGLLFLIFSVSLLRLVAGDIIKLPGF